MKKILVFLVVNLFCLGAQAQLKKGRIFVGGNIGYFQDKSDQKNSNVYNSITYYTTSSTDYSNLRLGLNAGYMLTDHLGLGLLFNFENYNQSQNVVSDSPYSPYSYTTVNEQNAFSGGLFARYYQMIKESRFGVFAQVEGTYGLGKYEATDTQSGGGISPPIMNKNETDFNRLFFGIRPGVVFFLNDHFGLETSLGLLSYSKQDETSYRNNIQTGTGDRSGISANFSISSLFLGMNYYF